MTPDGQGTDTATEAPARELPAGVQEVSVKSGKSGLAAKFDYEFGADLQAACDLYGEDIVYRMYFAAAKVDVQGRARRALDVETPPERVVTSMADYTLGEGAGKADPMTSILRDFDKLEGDEASAMLEKLKAKLGL